MRQNLNLENVHIKKLKGDFEEDHSLHVSQIAKQKAREAYNEHQLPVLCLDAGFYIPSLNNYPGAHVKDLMSKGNEWLFEQLQNKDRSCYWQHAIAYMDDKLKEPIVFCDKEPGMIASEERGRNREWVWSSIAKVFIPNGHDKTLCEMSKEEYYSKAKRYESEPYHKMFRDWYSQNRLK